MNKSHRIVWSKSRNTYVVVYEHATSHGTGGTRKATASAVTAALLALGGMAQAQAAVITSCASPITTTSEITSLVTDGTCVLSGGASLSVGPAGGIIPASRSGINVSSSSTAGSIVNSGTISAPVAGIQISHAVVSGITNLAGGAISGSNTGLDVTNYSTVTGSIVNSGRIESRGAGAVALEIVSTSTVVGGVTNSGGVITGVAPDGDAVYVAGGGHRSAAESGISRRAPLVARSPEAVLCQASIFC